MLKKQSSQYGSTAGIVTILILVVLLAAALGYAWWQNSARVVYPLASNQATSAQKETTPTKNSDSDSSSNKNYLVIKEWGVKLKTTTSEHLTYKPYSMTDVRSPEPFDVLGLTIKSSSVIDQDCVNFGADLYRQHTPSDRFETKKIGDYYYYVTGAPGVCSDEPSDVQLQQNALIDLKIANLEAI